MNEQTLVEKKRNSPPRGAGGAKKTRRFSKDEKLKAVRLYLEEGFNMTTVCEEVGVSRSCLGLWLEAFRSNGEAGLEPAKSGPRKHRLPAPITDQILELKRQNPTFGIKRISQVLRRWFFLPASPETVRQRLHEADLMGDRPPRKQRNITRPRFFERATPNQMWQTDIFTFRLGGRYAYLIAFMDDYSRFSGLKSQVSSLRSQFPLCVFAPLLLKKTLTAPSFAPCLVGFFMVNASATD